MARTAVVKVKSHEPVRAKSQKLIAQTLTLRNRERKLKTMAKDKKAQKEAAQEQKAPEKARHSAKERPRLRSRFDKEVGPALLKELELKNPMAVPRLHKIVVNMGRS